MRWQGRKQSSNVEDRRGQGSRIGGKSTGIIGIIILLVGAYYGVDLSGVVGSPAAGTQVAQPSTLNSQQEAQLNELARVVLADTETTWSQYFANNNARYTPPTMVLYTAGTQTACGTGQAAMGPFYCPQDRKVYLDLSFYEDMRKQLGASGDAAFAYVIAHERPPCAKSARHFAASQPSATRRQRQAGQCAFGETRIAGRLLCRHLGQPRSSAKSV